MITPTIICLHSLHALMIQMIFIERPFIRVVLQFETVFIIEILWYFDFDL